MCIEVVEKCPWLLTCVLDHFKTQEVCDKAIGAGSYILWHIPDWFVKQRPLEIRHNYKCDKWYDRYQKRKAQKAQIKKDLMPIVWYPSRWWDWCVPNDEKQEAEKLWG